MHRVLPLLLALATLFPAAAVEASEEVVLHLPPASLGQWYKPANKRQVWLHNMFALRRAMQAVSEYAARGDRQRLEQWTGRLLQGYRRIGEMVPEWKDRLKPKWADRLETAVAAGDQAALETAQRKIAGSCTRCHRRYRAVTAALYRSADFREVTVEDSETMEDVPYDEFMDRLAYTLNAIKIALGDGRKGDAAEATELLATRLEELASSCSGCHPEDAQRQWILGASSEARLAEIRQSIAGDRVKQGIRNLGGLAVEVCARCHGIHRTLSDLRELIAPE